MVQPQPLRRRISLRFTLKALLVAILVTALLIVWMQERGKRLEMTRLATARLKVDESGASSSVYKPLSRRESYYDDSEWKGTWALDGGGALMNQGIHSIDLLQWIVDGRADAPEPTLVLNKLLCGLPPSAVASLRRAGVA